MRRSNQEYAPYPVFPVTRWNQTYVLPLTEEDDALLRRVAGEDRWRIRRMEGVGSYRFARVAYHIAAPDPIDDPVNRLVEVHGWRGWWAEPSKADPEDVAFWNFIDPDQTDKAPEHDLGRLFAGAYANPKEQVGLFGAKQAEVEGFALVSPKGKPVERARPGKGTQAELVSRKVSREMMEEMRRRELAERAGRKKRKKKTKNPLRLEDYEEFCAAVADAYDAAPVFDEGEAWRWDVLMDSVERTYGQVAGRVQVRFVDGNPYGTAEQMRREVARTGILEISRDGGAHPRWTPEQNLRFRAVHDFVVHILPGEAGPDFGRRGEMRAYNLHRRLAPRDAWPALFTEIAAQACYVNARREFPVQKVAVLPQFDYYDVGWTARERAANPERWLAPQLSTEDRARLEQLHDVYFAMFDELESLPDATMQTAGGHHTVPEGYALLIQIGPTDYAFFQDAEPEETWSFVTVGHAAKPDEVEHLRDYLAVLERVNALVVDQVRPRPNRRPNLTTSALASDVTGALAGGQLAGIPGAVVGGLAGHELEHAVHTALLKRRVMP